MVQHQEEGSSARTEVLQVSTFDAEGTITSFVGYAESMAVDLEKVKS